MRRAACGLLAACLASSATAAHAQSVQNTHNSASAAPRARVVLVSSTPEAEIVTELGLRGIDVTWTAAAMQCANVTAVASADTTQAAPAFVCVEGKSASVLVRRSAGLVLIDTIARDGDTSTAAVRVAEAVRALLRDPATATSARPLTPDASNGNSRSSNAGNDSDEVTLLVTKPRRFIASAGWGVLSDAGISNGASLRQVFFVAGFEGRITPRLHARGVLAYGLGDSLDGSGGTASTRLSFASAGARYALSAPERRLVPWLGAHASAMWMHVTGTRAPFARDVASDDAVLPGMGVDASLALQVAGAIRMAVEVDADTLFGSLHVADIDARLGPLYLGAAARLEVAF